MKKQLFLHIYVAVTAIVLALLSFQVAAETPFVKNSDGIYYSADKTGENVTVASGVTGIGIDVSHHEGEINWDKIKAQYDIGNLDFVILRCGAGISVKDNYWNYNANSCERLGIPFGVYLYSKATNAAEASAEADVVLARIEGRNISYPVYYDIEDDVLHEKLGAATLKEIFQTFGEKIKAAGYEVGIYSSYSWLTDKKIFGTVDFEAENYSVWVAEYAPVPNYPGKFDIWQCSENGMVDGIEDKVDINFLYIEPRTADHCYVSFDMGEASGAAPSPIHLEKGKPYGELPVPRATDGKNFCGWYTSTEGGKKIDASDLLDKAGKLTLYAHWYYNVEFEFEHASLTGGAAVSEVTKDNPFQPLSITADEGYFLPDVLIGLPEGLTYTRSADKRSATVSGNVTDNLSLKVTALPELDRRIVFDGEYISTGMKNAIFTIDGEVTVTDNDGVLKIKENWLGRAVNVIYPRIDATVTLTLPARRPGPEGVFVRHETYLGKGDGEIIGLDASMEYSIDGGETFVEVGGERPEFVCDVEYIIRYKATGSDFCGRIVSTTIKSGRNIVVTFIVEGEEFMVYEVAYGEFIEVPELPELERCDMENSHWDIDLVDVPLTEDVTVTAVYQKLDGCGRPIPNEAAILLVAISALAFVVFKKKH